MELIYHSIQKHIHLPYPVCKAIALHRLLNGRHRIFLRDVRRFRIVSSIAKGHTATGGDVLIIHAVAQQTRAFLVIQYFRIIKILYGILRFKQDPSVMYCFTQCIMYRYAQVIAAFPECSNGCINRIVLPCITLILRDA